MRHPFCTGKLASLYCLRTLLWSCCEPRSRSRHDDSLIAPEEIMTPPHVNLTMDLLWRMILIFGICYRLRLAFSYRITHFGSIFAYSSDAVYRRLGCMELGESGITFLITEEATGNPPGLWLSMQSLPSKKRWRMTRGTSQIDISGLLTMF